MKLSFLSTHHQCFAVKFHHSPFTPFSPNPHRRKNCSPRMDAAASGHKKDKVIVVMGGTGAGKSRLSVDIATHFPPSEIINSDKIQVYRGLDITTNKMPIHERKGVPHHLLGDVDPDDGDFTPADFRLHGASIIADITSRSKLPIVAGGSNSFVYSLLSDRFNPEFNVFDSPELRYDCCFLWVDVAFPVLSEYLNKRVDEMIASGMVDELAGFFKPDSDDLEKDAENRIGLRKSIGVPEFDRYFKKYPPAKGRFNRKCSGSGAEDLVRKGAYEEAVRAIKENTCQLVRRQVRKIVRLKEAGWDLHRLDATEAFRLKMASAGGNGGGKRWSEIWEREVMEPSVKIVKRFLKE